MKGFSLPTSQLCAAVLFAMLAGCAYTLYTPDRTVFSRMSIAQAQHTIERLQPGTIFVLTRGGTAIRFYRADNTMRIVPFPALAASTEQVFYGVVPGDKHNPFCVALGGYLSSPPDGIYYRVKDNGVYIQWDQKVNGGWYGFQTREAARLFADAVYVLSHATISQLRMPEDPSVQVAFEKAAALYRASPEKPALPEEARRYKVQAEAAVGQQLYDDAIEFYKKALAEAPWWPEGHFNCALLMANVEDYIGAAREMKRYLTLAPDAPDARAALDKIYLWEGKIK